MVRVLSDHHVPQAALLVTDGSDGTDTLRRTFQIETICAWCQTPLRLISVIKTEETLKKILSAMGLPTEAPQPWPARAPPTESGEDGGHFLN